MKKAVEDAGIKGTRIGYSLMVIVEKAGKIIFGKPLVWIIVLGIGVLGVLFGFIYKRKE